MSKKVFISYSHTDEELKNRLINHLSSLVRKEAINIWHDRKLIAGYDFDHEIKQELLDSDLILFLISSEFIASDYINDVEVKKALDMHEKGDAIVVPIILRPCDWKELKFGKIQALPKDANPIINWGNMDQGFMSVIDGIKEIINGNLEKAPQISSKRYLKDTVNLPEKSLLVLLPRGYVIIANISYQDSESWSVKTHYWTYENQCLGSIHYNNSYKKNWESVEYRERQLNKLQIPIGDQIYADDILDLIIDLRERGKNEKITELIELYKFSELEIEYYDKEVELEKLSPPKKFQRLNETGYIRDLIKEFNTTHLKNYDLKTLHKDYNSKRRNALLWFCNRLSNDHPIIQFIKEEVNKYNDTMSLIELRDWANSMSTVLKDSLSHLS